MGLIDRLTKIGSGLISTFTAAPGLLYDFARAPFTDDDELDGFVHTLVGRTQHRATQPLRGLFGPDTGVGAVLGALPEGARQPVRAVTQPILGALETVGREAIREPLTTGTLTLGGIPLDEAYRLAQTTSPGQAFAASVLDVDLRDDQAVQAAMGTDAFTAISGTYDGLIRLFLEPDNLVGGAVSKARAATVTSRIAEVPGLGRLARGIETVADIDKVMGDSRTQAFGGRVRQIMEEESVGAAAAETRTAAGVADRATAVERTAARVKDLAFHDTARANQISSVLAEVADAPPEIFDTALGALMGRKSDLEFMRQYRPEVAGPIDRLAGEQAGLEQIRLKDPGGDGQFELPREMEERRHQLLTQETDALYPRADRLAMIEEASGTIGQVPRITATSEARHRLTRSAFYQDSYLGAPLRVTFGMRPRAMVDLADTAGDVSVSRFLRKTHVAPEVQDQFRGAYMAAATPEARAALLEQMEDVGIRNLGVKHNIPESRVEDLLAEVQVRRRKALDQINRSRRVDENGKTYISIVDDNQTVHELYMDMDMTSTVSVHPLADLDRVEGVMSDLGQYFERNKILGDAAHFPGEVVDLFQSVWKPMVLIRPGWPIRVVGEGNMRIMAKIGALTTAKNLTKATKLDKVGTAAALERLGNHLAQIPGESSFRKTVQGYGGRLAERETGIRKARPLPKYGLPTAFDDVHGATRARVSANDSFQRVLLDEKQIAAKLEDELVKTARSIGPTHHRYAPAWEKIVNQTMRRDQAWSQLLRGKSVDDVAEWLRTEAGTAYAQRRWRGTARAEEFLDAMQSQMDELLPTRELRDKALAGRATMADLETAVPEANLRPQVHDEVANELVGRSKLGKRLRKIRDKTFYVLGTLPIDVLARNPFFEHMYGVESQRMAALAVEQGTELTTVLRNDIAAKARDYALGETNKLLYDLAERSDLSHLLKFVSPFYMAWQEVLTRWTGLAIENPAFVSKMRQVWNSPERAGLVVDEKGNRIHEDGTATDALGNKVEAGKERILTIPLPEVVKDIPGMREVGDLRFNKDGFNLIMQGSPGVNPIVAIPLNQIAKGRPDLEHAFRWALPMGVSNDIKGMLLPASINRIRTATAGEEDRDYANSVWRTYSAQLTDFQLGRRTEAPKWEDAKRETDAFWSMRTIASFVSPVAPGFSSPYQFYIDAYKSMRDADMQLPAEAKRAPGYKSPDERFTDQFGEEFFALTQSVTKSMDGVPPTMEALEARERYRPLIEKYPELGNLIIGAEGAGEFSRMAYDSQFTNPVGPDAPTRQREVQPFEEIAPKPNVRLGWMKYRKAMDVIEANRVERGLPNLQVRAATDLRAMKSQVTRKLSAQYPEWGDDFNAIDMQGAAKRLTALRAIAGDDRLAQRDEFAKLRQYMRARDVFVNALGQRKASGGAATLSAATNTDLAQKWNLVTGKLIEQSLPFADLYYRYLERDQLEAV